MSDENYNELLQEVESRRQDLIEEWGEDEYDMIEVNEILRDEFGDSKYEQILIDLDINDDDLGLKELEKDNLIDSNDDEKKDNIVKSMLLNSKHLKSLYLTLSGYEEVRGKLKYRGKSLIPKSDIQSMMKVINALYQPQSLSGKLQKNIKHFDDHYNSILNNFRIRLENYTDDICNAKEMRTAIDLYLNEVQVVRSAIISGRLGDLTRDIAINSYNEKEEIKSADDRIDKLKKELKIGG